MTSSPDSKVQVTVAMPVYNSARFLGPAIQSILDQSIRDIELIVVDDGSTDGSRRRIRSYAESDRRIITVFQKHEGYPAALNRALKMARAPYFARMDSDDMCLPERLKRQVAFLNDHPHHALVGTRGYRLTPNSRIVPGCPKAHGWRELRWEDVHGYRRELVDPSVMMRTAVARELDGYRTVLPSSADVDLWLRLLERYRGACLLDPLYLTRMRCGSISFGLKSKSFATGRLVRRWAAQRRRCGSDPVMRGEFDPASLPTTPIRRKVAASLARCARSCASAGDRRAAFVFGCKALSVAPADLHVLKVLVRTLVDVLPRGRAPSAPALRLVTRTGF